MCLNPRKILNPALNWHIGMPKYVVVNCNVCSECRAKKQQEWFLRSRAEYRKNRNGSNFFVTLTFRDDDLPFYEDIRDFEYVSRSEFVDTPDYKHIVYKPIKMRTIEQSEDGSIRYKNVVNFRFPCFDGKMLTSFMKKFRVYCHRKFPNYDVSGIKFLICPEYGKLTQRQHFHLYIAVPFFLPVKEFRDICSRAWTHGWIGASKNKGFLIKSLGALQYTSKYVNKDMYYFNNAMQKYLDKDSLDEAEYRYRYEKVKPFLPRVRVSKGFGSSLAKEILSRKDAIDFCCEQAPIEVLGKNGKHFRYAIPRYIMSKLTREVDKHMSALVDKPVYRFTEFGMKLRKELFLKRFLLDELKIRQFSDSQYILDTLQKCDKFENSLRIRISQRLPELLQTMNPRDFVFYRRFLRYLPIDKYGKHTAFWYNRRFEDIIDDYFNTISIPYEVALSQKYRCGPLSQNHPLYKYDEIGTSLREFYSPDIHTLSELGEFRLYEEACSLLDRYYFLHSRQRGIVVDRRDERLDEVRYECNDFVLYPSRVKVAV